MVDDSIVQEMSSEENEACYDNVIEPYDTNEADEDSGTLDPKFWKDEGYGFQYEVILLSNEAHNDIDHEIIQQLLDPIESNAYNLPIGVVVLVYKNCDVTQTEEDFNSDEEEGELGHSKAKLRHFNLKIKGDDPQLEIGLIFSLSKKAKHFNKQ